MCLTSCVVHSKKDKAVSNLKTMQSWLEEDFKFGHIEYGVANNYYMLLETIIYDLQVKKDGTKVNKNDFKLN